MPRINAFLELGRKQGCSDVHLAVGIPPMLRMLGEIMTVKYRDLSADELHSLMAEILTDKQQESLNDNIDLDFSYSDPDVGRFRVNVYKKLGGLGATFRVIPDTIPSLEELQLPSIVSKMIQHINGLVLITGTTGMGKTTTLASIVDEINKTRRFNIITLEDPIEFVHRSNQSLVIQREVGNHVSSFHEGLRAALREDPDVIMVGELRDPETISMAMTAAETGHLVLGTLHTSTASKTLDRIIDVMPTEQKALTTSFLAQHLRGVISQRLVRTTDGKSRMAVAEILVNTAAIANLIMNGKIFQIPSQLLTGKEKGMQLMDQAILNALLSKKLDPDDAYLNADDKSKFQQYVTNPDILPHVNLTGRH